VVHPCGDTLTQPLVGTPPSSCTSSAATTTVGVFGVHQVSSSLTVVCIDSFVVVVDNLNLVLSIDIQYQFVVEELFHVVLLLFDFPVHCFSGVLHLASDMGLVPLIHRNEGRQFFIGLT
jgi:hypothetical protein